MVATISKSRRTNGRDRSSRARCASFTCRHVRIAATTSITNVSADHALADQSHGCQLASIKPDGGNRLLGGHPSPAPCRRGYVRSRLERPVPEGLPSILLGSLLSTKTR